MIENHTLCIRVSDKAFFSFIISQKTSSVSLGQNMQTAAKILKCRMKSAVSSVPKNGKTASTEKEGNWYYDAEGNLRRKNRNVLNVKTV